MSSPATKTIQLLLVFEHQSLNSQGLCKR